MRLWRDLATRYADETVVLGYDLLNEPLPNEWQHTYADELASLYRELTAEIRAVDPDHLIMYEGSHWATNWDIFTEVWDENSALQFHKYWSSPDVASISTFLEARDRLGLPIYMGEGGENTLEWIYAAFRLYEAHDIGWNFWPWKKVATRTSPVSIVPPDRMGSGHRRDPRPRGDRRRRGATRLRRPDRRDAAGTLRLAARRRRRHARGASHRDPRAGASDTEARENRTARHPLVRFRGSADDDAVTLAWVVPGGNPPNPFEQSDGRPYRPDEELVAMLNTGDWLEFEAPGVTDARVVGPDGSDAAVRVDPSPRGSPSHRDRPDVHLPGHPVRRGSDLVGSGA